MEFKASQIAALVGGEILGNPDAIVTGFAKIEEGQANCISFLGDVKFLHCLESNPSSVIIVSRQVFDGQTYPNSIILVDDAYLAMQLLMNEYVKLQNKKTGIEQPAFVSPSAKLGEDVYVAAFAYIDENALVGDDCQILPHAYIGKNVKMGKNCIIHSGAKIYDDTVLGDRVVVQANTVIGTDGFGYQPDENGYKKIPQLGNVILEDDVEVGANGCIDRATLGSTIIKKGTKLDNLIQIAHNVNIGEHNVIAAQAGIAGSTHIGNWNMIGGQAGIAGHLKLGNQLKIQAQSGVNYGLKDGETVYGSPAIDAGNYRRSYVHFKNLSKLANQINELEKKTSKPT